MKTLLLRNTNPRQIQYQILSYALILVMLLGGIQNWWSGVYKSTVTMKIPVIRINRVLEFKHDAIATNQLSVVGLAGLGAMGASEQSIVKQINLKDKLAIEKNVENDPVYKTILDDRKMMVNDVKNSLVEEKERYLLENQIENITCNTADITKTSNMTKDQIGIMLDGTWLEGEEETLYRVEQEAGVNAFFIYAVATLESGHGTSVKSTKQNNYYGITVSRKFESYSHNTDYFGGMMNRVYISKGHIDVNKIGPIYCPPNPNWSNVVSDLMLEQYEKMIGKTVA